MVTIALTGHENGGKKTLVDVLVKHLGYTLITLDSHLCENFMSKISLNDGDKNLSMPLSALNEFVTKRWQQHFITIVPESLLLQLIETELPKRPFFVMVRLQRPGSCVNANVEVHPDIITLSIVNDGSVEQLSQAAISKLSPSSITRHIRPPWDDYFMSLARLAERRSNCMKRRVGAVIVRDFRVISTGYNGTPRNVPNCFDGGCGRCNSGTQCGRNLNECLCLHAEENAIVEAGRSRAEQGTLYCTTKPCLGCAKKIVQVGISRVVWGRDYSTEHNSLEFLAGAGVKCDRVLLPSAVIVCSNCDD
jgi:dCMP deaminase